MDTILGPGKGIWGFQSNCSFSTVIWLANHRHHCLLYKLNHCLAPAQPCWPIRSEICISAAVGARPQSQPNQGNGPNSPDTLSLREVGSGHETTLPYNWTCCWSHNTCTFSLKQMNGNHFWGKSKMGIQMYTYMKVALWALSNGACNAIVDKTTAKPHPPKPSP